MRALVVQADKTVKVEEKPTPKAKANEILLKVITVGQNPTDWKHAAYFSEPGAMIGCDFVGKVVELGSDVPTSQVPKGQLRWGFMRGGLSPDKGAFAEYVTAEWDITSVVPPNITAEQAASLPIPLVTAIQCLYLSDCLGLPEPDPHKDTLQTDKWMLVWSGATAVGQFVIQLAKLSGLKVATTASPRRWDMLKGLGADFVVDYKDPDVIAKLKEATGDSIEMGLDCISEGGTIEAAQLAFSPGGGRLMTLLFQYPELPRAEVKTKPFLAYTSLGHPSAFGTYEFQSPPEHRAQYVRWCKIATELLESGKLKPLDIEVLGGLEDVQKGFEMMQNNVHNSKLVYRVAT